MSSPKTKNREMSDYQKFRIQKLQHKRDDDNVSAHFSANRMDQTDREEDALTFLTVSKHHSRNLVKQSVKQNEVSFKLVEKQMQCHQLQIKYMELMKKYEESQKQVQYYKKKYEQRVQRERETKRKLQGWVKTAKNELMDNKDQ